MDQTKGKFIVIEGLDGSGKTLQARKLVEHLRQRGYKVSFSFEPTNGPIGSIIRQAVLGRIQIDSYTLAAMFAADRLDHVFNPVNGVLKHINDGIIEISDRYDLTSYAYQTVSVDEDWVWQLNSRTIRPDLTIFLDVDPKECYRRLMRSQVDDELYHKAEHLEEARERYLEATAKLSKQEPIVTINGNADSKEVGRNVIAAVTEFLKYGIRLQS